MTDSAFSSALAFAVAAPEIVLAILAFLLLVLSVFGRAVEDGAPRTASPAFCDVARTGACWKKMSVANILALAAILTTMTLVVFCDTGAAFGGLFGSDPFARMAKILILGSGFVVSLAGLSFLRSNGLSRPEYPVLVLFALLGGMLMASAKDFLALYVGLELQSMALYVLAAFQREKASAADGGIKYFILGTLASALFLYGVSLLYGFSGTTLYEPFLDALRKAADAHLILVKIGMAFLFAGLAFKISIAPFHMWTADVYEDVAMPTTALFATVAKLSAFAALTRLLILFHEGLAARWGSWDLALQALAVASIFVGAFGGLAQTRLKKLFGFSAILNMGFALLPLALGANLELVRAAWIYLGLYVLNLLGVFSVLMALRREGVCVERIQDLAGLGKTHPALAACFSAFLFSLAGVPPLVGFLGKFFLFQSLIAQEALALVLFGLLASVAAAGYYLRLVKIMYFDPVAAELDSVPETSLRLVVVGAGVLVLVLTIVPSPLVQAVESAAESLRFP